MEDDGAVYPCPYCSEDFDDAELVEYHIREAHPSKSDYDSETCPVCAARIRTDMVEHLIARHRSSLDISFMLRGPVMCFKFFTPSGFSFSHIFCLAFNLYF
ncbi:hypothetical protein CRG98_009275 [Punica granatum]|uniref:C2H2-type domain-containing protein n=1 Tax=Punica granatum TaxID=22663 RepID=A0A2I0KPA9_PUNGR|nr:hypothetical protein CRG98_009275 [Punica granatum]